MGETLAGGGGGFKEAEVFSEDEGDTVFVQEEIVREGDRFLAEETHVSFAPPPEEEDTFMTQWHVFDMLLPRPLVSTTTTTMRPAPPPPPQPLDDHWDWTTNWDDPDWLEAIEDDMGFGTFGDPEEGRKARDVERKAQI